MPKTIHGMDLVLFFRKLADKATEDGARLRFQTEHSISEGKETESNPTKDGQVVNVTDGEGSIDFTSYAYTEDTGTIAMWETLYEWFKNREMTEIWEVNTENVTSEGNYNPTYYVGYFTDYEKSAPADGIVELNFTFTLEGSGVKGEDTLTEEQLATLGSKAREYESLNNSAPGV